MNQDDTPPEYGATLVDIDIPFERAVRILFTAGREFYRAGVPLAMVDAASGMVDPSQVATFATWGRWALFPSGTGCHLEGGRGSEIIADPPR